MNQEKFKALQNVIAQNLGFEISAITPSAKLKEDLGADSLDALHLVAAIEQEFQVEISLDSMEKIETVSDLWNYVKSALLSS